MNARHRLFLGFCIVAGLGLSGCPFLDEDAGKSTYQKATELVIESVKNANYDPKGNLSQPANLFEGGAWDSTLLVSEKVYRFYAVAGTMHGYEVSERLKVSLEEIDSYRLELDERFFTVDSLREQLSVGQASRYVLAFSEVEERHFVAFLYNREEVTPVASEQPATPYAELMAGGKRPSWWFLFSIDKKGHVYLEEEGTYYKSKG